MPQECDYITMLREPVARVVSTYHHVLDHPRHWFHDEAVGNDMGLEEFVEAIAGPADNLQTRLLAGRVEGELVTRADGSVAVTPLGAEALEEARANLDRFLVVGLTERFDESFILVRRALGWRLPMYATRNAARGPRRAAAERPGGGADRTSVTGWTWRSTGTRSKCLRPRSSARAPHSRARSPRSGC